MVFLLQRAGASWKPGTGSILKFSLELHAEVRFYWMVGNAGTFTVMIRKVSADMPVLLRSALQQIAYEGGNTRIASRPLMGEEFLFL